eukprot:14763656-Alexandrium_andersonii.AAC.1
MKPSTSRAIAASLRVVVACQERKQKGCLAWRRAWRGALKDARPAGPGSTRSPSKACLVRAPRRATPRN